MIPIGTALQAKNKSSGTAFKYLLLAVMLLSVMLLGGGCLDLSVHLTVNRDGSAEQEITLLVEELPDELASLPDGRVEEHLQELKEELSSHLEAENYSLESYAENDKVGLKATRSWESWEEIELPPKPSLQDNFSNLSFSSNLTSSSNPTSENWGSFSFHQEEGVLVNTYHLSGNIDMSELPWVAERALEIVSPELAFLLTLPLEPTEHNADVTGEDGRTLEWHLEPGEENHLHVTLRAPHIQNIILASVLGICALLTVGFLIYRKKKQA